MLVNRNSEDSENLIYAALKALGGEPRSYHPRFYVNEWAEAAHDPLIEHPEDVKEDWYRPNLEPFTHDINEAHENYLAENLHMERMNGQGAYRSDELEGEELNQAKEVDLVVTEGPFKDTLVQAKCAALRVTRGDRPAGGHKSTPGGIYMRDNLPDLRDDWDQDALLYVSIHYPRTDFEDDLPVPTVPVVEKEDERLDDSKLETAYVGDFIMPVKRVLEEVEFYPSGYRNWEWPDALGEIPEPDCLVDRWLKDSFISENLP
ncbi:MAG: hypothetical protein H8Z69_05870 [Nanohaloarchaea archaeon]|nr:hypothetical protein [Candidatus Nanohaloarchaea archaeon]